MWLITGPFDSDEDVSTKTKLLKTGRKFPLGRKDRPLLVNNKKISRDHCEFTVGSCTEEEALDPSFVPTLEIHNAKDKPMLIEREGQPVVLNPTSSQRLKSGDKIKIVVGISVQVHWRRVACFMPPARALPSISGRDCAALGVSLMTSPSALATHHLTPNYELAVPLATSLLSATQLVKVEWLQELVRLGTTVDESHPFKLTPLEQSFAPPLESKYRPTFSPSLPSSLKSFKFWEPNEERLHLFKGHRFVILGDAEGRADTDIRELALRGDGEYEFFPLTNGETKWRQLLAKAKRKVDEAGLKVALVARQLAVQASVGADRWREMTEEAQSLSLPLIPPDALVNAVVHTDVSFILAGSSNQGASAESESPLPDFVPNTHPSEPSLPVTQENPPAESKEAPRKSASPPSSFMLFGLPVPPPPSKNLVRRSKPPSIGRRAEEPVAKDETQAELGYTLPPPSTLTRSTMLKRRIRSPAPPVEEPAVEYEPNEEPPHKKFKALFDASAPGKMAINPPSLRDDNMMEDSAGTNQDGESCTQTCDSRPLHSPVVVPPRTLAVVHEEEEESVRSQARPPDPVSARPGQEPPLPQAAQQPRVVATQNSKVTSKPPSKHAASKSSQSHQMDTDPAFLTALASRKGRKKQAEDEFDREFNKLRISKPDIRREEDEQAWEVLGDFDTDTRGMRGNFMVILELDVFRRDSLRNTTGAVHTYDGRLNFKKFRKVPATSSRTPIELVARAEHDYGVGSGYWKGTAASQPEDSLALTQTAGTQKRRAPTVLESDDADTDVPPTKPVKKATRKPRIKAAAATEKLFLNSDEEVSMQDSQSQGTRTKSRTEKADPEPKLPTRASKRRHIIVEDDSDDGLAFKGFGKKRKVL